MTPDAEPGPGHTRAVRRFRDDEVALILARAAAQEGRPDLPAPHDPTLTDLMAAAAEAGLDPADVRRSAAIAPAAPPGATSVLLGAPDRREVRAFLDGLSLPAKSHTLVRAAERATGRSGTVTERVAGRFDWRESHLGGGTHVVISDAPDGVELRVTSDRAGSYVGMWFTALIAWAGLSALTPLGSLGPLAAALGFLVGPLLLARPFWTRSDAGARRRLERIAMDLIRALEEPAG